MGLFNLMTPLLLVCILSQLAEGIVLLQLGADLIHGKPDHEPFNVLEAGAKFNDRKCLRARTSNGKQAWRTSEGHVLDTLEGDFQWHQDYVFANLNGRQDENGEWWVDNATSPYIAYVRNQKVASRFLTGVAMRVMGAAQPPMCTLASYENPKPLPSINSFNGQVVNVNPRNPIFAFTVVRDPLQAVLAAYMEITVTRRTGLIRPDVKDEYKEWLDWPCGTKAEANARFRAFLEVIRQYGIRDQDIKDLNKTNMFNLGKEMFHIFPQALKLTVRVEGHDTLEAIGRLENLYGDLREIRKAVSGIDANITEIEEDATATHSHAEEGCANIDPEDPEMMKSFCELYSADYVCFPGYELPAACKMLAVDKEEHGHEEKAAKAQESKKEQVAQKAHGVVAAVVSIVKGLMKHLMR